MDGLLRFESDSVTSRSTLAMTCLPKIASMISRSGFSVMPSGSSFSRFFFLGD